MNRSEKNGLHSWKRAAPQLFNYPTSTEMTTAAEDEITLSKDLDKLREDFQRIQRKVDKLQFKLDWYEGLANKIVFFGVIFLFLLSTRHAKNDKEIDYSDKYKLGYSEYGIFHTGNSRYEGEMKISRKERSKQGEKEVLQVSRTRDGFGYEFIKEAGRNVKKEGYWQNDKLEGYSAYVEGKVSYEGQWKDDKMTGYGFIVNTDGSCHSGAWINDTRNGYGVFQEANGDRYEGMWVDNHLNDTAIRATFANQSQYVGSFYNKQFNGYGVYIWPDGTRFEAIWEDGRPASEGTFLIPMFRSVKGAFEDYENVTSKTIQQGKSEK